MARGYDDKIDLDFDRLASDDTYVFPPPESYKDPQGGLLALLWGIRRDLADIRLDLVGDRGQPHGPTWSGNLDERLWALTQSAAELGSLRVIIVIMSIQTLLLGAILYKLSS